MLFPPTHRLAVIVLLIAGFAVVTGVINQLVPRATATGGVVWSNPRVVPTLDPLGADLRLFIEGSLKTWRGESPLHANYMSPPLNAALFFPFILMPAGVAYTVQFWLIVAANALGISLLFLLLRRGIATGTSGPAGGPELAAVLALFAVSAAQFDGYPFEFALERGNYDSWAFAAMAAGLWVMCRRPDSVWTAVVLFSLAAHLKVYPAILLLLPLWKHRGRAVLPLVVVNGLMLFSMGVPRALEYLSALPRYSQGAYTWPGNHSAFSFNAEHLEPWLATMISPAHAHHAGLAFLVLLPLGFWAHGTRRLFHAGPTRANLLLAAALATPLMCILTSVSNDYKLVILPLVTCLCLAHFAAGFLRTGGIRPLAALVLTLACLLLAARSVLLPPLLFTPNKYPVVLALQVLSWLAVCEQTRTPAQARAEAGPPPAVA